MQIRVYYEDTDCGGVVYHSNYLKFCERARSEQFFENNIIFDDNGYFIVSKLDAKFIKPAKLGDLLEIKTKVIQQKKVSILVNQVIYKDNIKIFEANILLAYMVKDKISPIPDYNFI